MVPSAMLRDQGQAVDAIRRGVSFLAEEGAEAVGLGALCAVVGSRGRAVAEDSPVPVITGHELTVWAACRTAQRLRRVLAVPAQEPWAVLGAPSPVAIGIAEVLDGLGFSVVLGCSKTQKPWASAGRAPHLETVPISTALEQFRCLVSASSGGGVTRAEKLRPGAIFIDVARPRDLIGRLRRPDIYVVDGEMVSLPPWCRVDAVTGVYQRCVGQSREAVFGCFAAPMLAAARPELVIPTGRWMTPDQISAWGAAAESEGFHVDRIYCRGRAVPRRAALVLSGTS